MQTYDVVVIGAGAAGMMAAIEAGRRGRRVLVLDHARSPGEKIRISGGGRCNFTNLRTSPDRFLSANPRFCVSALSRYTPADFVRLVERHGIAYHEKTLGQLFCDGSARQVVAMLVAEMRDAGAELRLNCPVAAVEQVGSGFLVRLGDGAVGCDALVVATGGKSIPKMGATGMAYDIARGFGLRVTETRPGLVPLTLDAHLLARLAPLSGIAVEAEVRCGKTAFREALLFTHRGLSGPAILQISSYWREGREIEADLAAGIDVLDRLKTARAQTPRLEAQTVLAGFLPRRLAQLIAEGQPAGGMIGDWPDRRLEALVQAVSHFTVKPVGSEGYRTAEVTLGGIDTRDLDSRTMQARAVPGLYFVGEAVDVTGWLGGYNFQWAWASGWAAGQVA